MARGDKLGLTAVRTEGAMLPPSILRRIHELSPTLGGLTPEDFGLSGTRIREAASQAWNSLQGPWNALKAEREKLGPGDAGTGITRRLWLSQILRVLDYGVIEPLRHSLAVDETEFAISHLFNNKVPLHLIGCGQNLDKKGVGAGCKRSPHGLVQQLLNSTDRHLWAFLSNGVLWRVLRDDQSLSRQSMVEFDLESIFEGQLYDEFLLFYLVCHQSRVRSEKPEDCWLEKWHLSAGEEGKRALNTLRSGVEDAIKALGQGYLSHPANTKLRERIRSGELDKQDYYRQLLRQIYRLIFLFVAEDRGLLADPKASPSAKQLYLDSYSTLRLRRIAERTPGSQRHHDLYSGFKLVLKQLGKAGGCPELGLPALGSFLFSEESAEDLSAAEISNAAFLQAIKRLSTTVDGGRRARIDYRNLGTEELGSVYESLLELHPEFSRDGSYFQLLSASGNERKTSGSYYTPDSLIQCLLDTALEPVVEEAISKAGRDAKRREEAILDLKVIDPAVGSGHFLIAAAHRLAKRLAQVRAGEDEPSPHERQKALRDVIGRCLYGIDINPMAAELCRVSLWIESMEPGRPLSFLDHHIVVGNSLIGTTPELIAQGIPDGAFDAIEGDDKEVCKNLKKQNKKEREGQDSLFDPQLFSGKDVLAAWRDIEAIPGEELGDVKRKETAFHQAEAALAMRRQLADTWCAAFTLPKKPSSVVITTSTLQRLVSGVTQSDAELAAVTSESKRFGFLHPHLAFPGVFAKGGFDVVLGNPPWERVKLQEKEFFATSSPEISGAQTAAHRSRLIEKLASANPLLYDQYLLAKRRAETDSLIVRNSGRFPLSASGDTNTYPLFIEVSREYISPSGRVGLIVKTGILSDYSMQGFFEALISYNQIVSAFDFSNAEALFPGVVANERFLLLTLKHASTAETALEVSVLNKSVAELADPQRRWMITAKDIGKINPNTKTCPLYQTRKDSVLVNHIYSSLPVMIQEREIYRNPWQCSYYTMYHMTNDSEIFSDLESIQSHSDSIATSQWNTETESFSALSEGKLFDLFDHRFGTFFGVPRDSRFGVKAEPNHLSDIEKASPINPCLPRYWVPTQDVEERLIKRLGFVPSGLLVYRDVCRTHTDFRTVRCCINPTFGAGNKAPIILFPGSSRQEYAVKSALMCANFGAIVFDYVARQKFSGGSLNRFILIQLPIVPPNSFLHECSWSLGPATYASFVLSRVLELTFVSMDLQEFAKDLEFEGPPFIWNIDRRFWLRAELDAAFFHLYGINRDDVAYIMETFPIVKRKDVAAHGTFRTKEAILAIYDEMAEAAAMGGTYKTRLDPPPANGWVPPPLPPIEEITEPPSGSGGAKAKSGKRRPRGSDVDPISLAPPLPFD